MFTTALWWVASSWGAQTAPLCSELWSSNSERCQTHKHSHTATSCKTFGGGKVWGWQAAYCNRFFDFGAIWPLQHKSPIPKSDRVPNSFWLRGHLAITAQVPDSKFWQSSNRLRLFQQFIPRGYKGHMEFNLLKHLSKHVAQKFGNCSRPKTTMVTKSIFHVLHLLIDGVQWPHDHFQVLWKDLRPSVKKKN
jgi:hypothetical protein